MAFGSKELQMGSFECIFQSQVFRLFGGGGIGRLKGRKQVTVQNNRATQQVIKRLRIKFCKKLSILLNTLVRGAPYQ